MKTASEIATRSLLLGFLGFLALGAGGPSGCHKDDKAYVALSPLAVVVPRDQLWHAAEFYASLRPNAQVMSGDGVGMVPLYAPGTLIVVEPADYKALKEGMTVVFTEPDGKRAARYLVRLDPDGWTTRGFNPPTEDPSPVTPANYIGTVTMAFAPEQKPASR